MENMTTTIYTVLGCGDASDYGTLGEAQWEAENRLPFDPETCIVDPDGNEYPIWID